MANWYNAIIERIEHETPNTKRFWLRPEQPLPFRAGQFVVMDLPISEKRLQRWRSYSIANAPKPDGIGEALEFCVVRFEGGAGTRYLFDVATVGTTIRFKEPSGVFVLPQDVSQRQLVMVCTGTGVAPFRSMIHDLLNRKQPYASLHLIFGTRYAAGLLYKNEFLALANQLPNFRYSVALSRENPPLTQFEGVECYSGYVHSIYENMFSNNINEQRHFYLCGWSNMIDEARIRLKALGYAENQIHFELFG